MIMNHELAGTPRERRRERTYDAILDAGLALVVEGGLDALTIARLAAKVDLTPGAIYRYLPGKEAIIAALNARVLEGWASALDHALAAAPPTWSALERALLPVHLYVRLALAQPAPFALLALTLAEPRVLVVDPANAVHLPALRRLLVRFAVGLAAVAPNAGPGQAIALLLGVTGVLQVRKLARFDAALFDARALAHGLVATQLAGLGVSALAVQAAQARVEAFLESQEPMVGGS